MSEIKWPEINLKNNKTCKNCKRELPEILMVNDLCTECHDKWMKNYLYGYP